MGVTFQPIQKYEQGRSQCQPSLRSLPCMIYYIPILWAQYHCRFTTT
ncbi:hypothetical protein RIEGSTA812A_PEG_588 [invertebrate metagenome]|uniref:Uncharacterized protein n=1 Tax=invertebrate metagenome TaxID=1711999 RepID=A0A484H6W4_9ZZZZ